MPSSNTTVLCGHVVRDPETRNISAGLNICTFSIATTKRWKAKDGTDKEKTSYIDVKVWGPTGDEVYMTLKKGDAAIVLGELDMEQWDDKSSGQKRSKLVIKADIVGQAIYRKKDAPPKQAARSAQPKASSTPAATPESDDVPF